MSLSCDDFSHDAKRHIVIIKTGASLVDSCTLTFPEFFILLASDPPRIVKCDSGGGGSGASWLVADPLPGEVPGS